MNPAWRSRLIPTKVDLFFLVGLLILLANSHFGWRWFGRYDDLVTDTLILVIITAVIVVDARRAGDRQQSS